MRWFRLAAAQAETTAQVHLGVHYATGQGVPEDDGQAYMWFNLAASQGNETATENRDLLAERMTAADISEAQRLAREWKPK